MPTAHTTGAVTVGGGKGVRLDFSAGGIVLDDVERTLIVEALGATHWNRARAAQLLGISAETLRYRMEKHQLKRSPVE